VVTAVVVSASVLLLGLAAVALLALPGVRLIPTPPVVPQPPAAAPDVTVTTAPGAGAEPVAPIDAWARRTAPQLGMDPRALQAYAGAQQTLRRTQPRCRLGWPTLAAIGWVESRNGRHGGSSIGADGVVRPTILGPALDGTGGFALIRSTDGGRLDGDTVYDHAVGPMQLLPATWRRYGHGNPSNYEAAALAAGRYLCANAPRSSLAPQPSLATAAGWRSAVLAYNHSLSYLADVAAAAGWYAAGGDRPG